MPIDSHRVRSPARERPTPDREPAQPGPAADGDAWQMFEAQLSSIPTRSAESLVTLLQISGLTMGACGAVYMHFAPSPGSTPHALKSSPRLSSLVASSGPLAEQFAKEWQRDELVSRAFHLGAPVSGPLPAGALYPADLRGALGGFCAAAASTAGHCATGVLLVFFRAERPNIGPRGHFQLWQPMRRGIQIDLLARALHQWHSNSLRRSFLSAHRLSQSDQSFLRCALYDCNTKRMAQQLGKSERAIDSQWQRVKDRLECQERDEAVSKAWMSGALAWVSIEPS